MAKIGLDNFYYSVIQGFDAEGRPKYTGPKKPGHAISAKVSIKSNSAELYADNILVESDTSFNSGTATFEIDREDAETLADLLGHSVEYTDDSGEAVEKGEAVFANVIRNTNDVAPYVGFARIVKKMVDGAICYKAEIIYKCKFSEPSQEENTSGESLAFKATSIEGSISALEDGDWSKSIEAADRGKLIKAIQDTFKNSAL